MITSNEESNLPYMEVTNETLLSIFIISINFSYCIVSFDESGPHDEEEIFLDKKNVTCFFAATVMRSIKNHLAYFILLNVNILNVIIKDSDKFFSINSFFFYIITAIILTFV
jgi:hypothetical protein